MPFKMLISHVTSVNITYMTEFSAVVVLFQTQVLSVDHCHPSLPSLYVLREAIHPEPLLGSIRASKCCTSNHGMTTDLLKCNINESAIIFIVQTF